MPHLSISHSPVFLLNSCLDLSAAPGSRQGPFSLSYGASLPSSLAVSLSSALVCSTRPPVSVCGTGRQQVLLRGFSWKYASLRSVRPEGLSVLSRFGSGSGFAWSLLRLRGYTRFSVSAPLFRSFVAPSPCWRAADFLPHVHRVRLAASP